MNTMFSFKKGLTTEEILGNALVFFAAGYDTTASTISFSLYNMALYPDIQEKLMQEITRVAGDKVCQGLIPPTKISLIIWSLGAVQV